MYKFESARQGQTPEMEELMAVRNAMVRTTDLRQPIDLGEQLMQRSGLSNDVGAAMVDLLQVLMLAPAPIYRV